MKELTQRPEAFGHATLTQLLLGVRFGKNNGLSRARIVAAVTHCPSSALAMPLGQLGAVYRELL